VDREMTERHLVLAERHVSQGLVSIARQEQTLARMHGAGHNTEQAEALLAGFMISQTHHEEHRDRLLKLLG